MPTSTAIHLNVELVYQLQRLKMAGAVLHVGAHPGDADAGLMTYMARHHGVRIVYWSATRGEGSANHIGPYTGEALGVFRTWESMEAREVDGGETLYGPFYDFGLSPSGEDALEKWGRENVVREIVRAIRIVQPVVVVSRWSGAAHDGNGQHQAIGQVIQEAFDMAGDPTSFPTLGLPAWQPQKLYVSATSKWVPGDISESGQIIEAFERTGFVRINTGLFDRLAGRTYQEQAIISFNSHKTQGYGVAPSPGDFYLYYELRTTLVPTPEREQDLFDGLDSTLLGLIAYAGDSALVYDALEYIQTFATTALEQFIMGRTIPAAYALLTSLKEIRTIRQYLFTDPMIQNVKALDQYLAYKESTFEAAIVGCMGLRLEGVSDAARVTPTQEFNVAAQLWNPANIPLGKAVFSLETPAGWQTTLVPTAHQAATSAHMRATYRVRVPENATLATPYWLRKLHSPFAYTWDGAPWDGQSFAPSDSMIVCNISIDGHELTLRQPVIMREAFAGGFRELTVMVVPPISIHPQGMETFLPASNQIQQIELTVMVRSNNKQTASVGRLMLMTPSRWQVSPPWVDVSLDTAGTAQMVTYTVLIPPNTLSGRYILDYSIQCDGRDYDVVLDPVRMVAPGLPGFPDEANCIQEQFITSPAQEIVYLMRSKSVAHTP